MRGLLASFWTIVNLSHKWRRSISLFEPERVCCISITHCIYYNLQAAWFFVSIYTHTRLIIPRNLRTCMLCAWILINTPTLISMNLSHPLNGVRAHIYKSDVITTIYTNPLLCLVKIWFPKASACNNWLGFILTLFSFSTCWTISEKI